MIGITLPGAISRLLLVLVLVLLLLLVLIARQPAVHSKVVTEQGLIVPIPVPTRIPIPIRMATPTPPAGVRMVPAARAVRRCESPQVVDCPSKPPPPPARHP